MRVIILSSVFVIACSGSTPSPTRSGPPAAPIATPARDDVQVATVAGRPVWASCVTEQAARGATRDEALQQCIDFELLAQAAETRGFGTDPDVVLATRTALVSELVAHEYEDKMTKPADFGAFWTRSLELNRGRFDHPEARISVYIRIEVPKGASADIDQAAKQKIDQLYAALANERGLMKPHLEEITKRTLGPSVDAKIVAAPADIHDGAVVKPYSDALFAIPEIGRVSPPVRTPWGWDIILWDNVIPAVHATPDEVIEAAMPDIKRGYFPHWVQTIAKNLGVHIEVVDKNLQLLERM